MPNEALRSAALVEGVNDHLPLAGASATTSRYGTTDQNWSEERAQDRRTSADVVLDRSILGLETQLPIFASPVRQWQKRCGPALNRGTQAMVALQSASAGYEDTDTVATAVSSAIKTSTGDLRTALEEWALLPPPPSAEAQTSFLAAQVALGRCVEAAIRLPDRPREHDFVEMIASFQVAAEEMHAAADALNS